ncbi:hypothetical protein LOZ12_000818 [Ophidiomyces ophidiicola]|nr:hypothetical protein LOZ62_000444 [Ophidiomyces ophidiicola]KAI2011627.1 hypothetical protein LOZ50_000648 [Ophidiomyces ophidiicola]KAI2056467.1 hypothetical protein LOZ38_000218 [Ophidiomyces ophidiicola]KAI2072016.1 hypothetical protein LOZ37_004455 [Ophidiomyces ophidiicola]KAI2082139.1 hypothetical protein LOZ39_000103 [Ophidiomyces ophidiicola]
MSKMPAGEDDLVADPPSAINPYEVLGIDEKATADQVKSAYRKQALKHHPDKAGPDSKDEAHKKFQEIAFAYAILSDKRRRKRYDTTGNTSESLDLEDDDFSWVDFFREQLSSMVDGAVIEKLKTEYQGSQEEREDLLEAYENFEGDLDRVYEEVMLSNVLEDDKRFRKIIKQAIRDGEVQDWPKFSEESAARRNRRVKAAKQEAEEAKELAKELGVEDKLFGKQDKKRTKQGNADEDDDSALQALIQQRQKSRGATFLANLEAKYGGASRGGKGQKRAAADANEPPEEAFRANRARTATKKKQKAG